MPWHQTYAPLGSVALSALVASLPVVVLLGLLGLHVRAHAAAFFGLLTAWAVAILVFGMPLRLASLAAAYGAAFGLFPIGWIVLNALFIYEVTVETGQFEVVKQSVAALAADRRIQALLIAFSFGAFIEGAAGFGTPVAISGAMLIGLGFRPLSAAGLSLIGNTAPVAFGALGTPLIALAAVTHLPLDTLSAMVGRQLPFFSLIVPFWLVAAMAGRRAVIEVWPACLTAGASFAATQFLVSNTMAPGSSTSRAPSSPCFRFSCCSASGSLGASGDSITRAMARGPRTLGIRARATRPPPGCRGCSSPCSSLPGAHRR